jgi:hypothetical protein
MLGKRPALDVLRQTADGNVRALVALIFVCNKQSECDLRILIRSTNSSKHITQESRDHWHRMKLVCSGSSYLPGTSAY